MAAGAMPGLGAAAGAVIEPAIATAAELAIGRMGRAGERTGPTVDGRTIKVSPPMESRFNSPGCDIKVAHMKVEDFDHYEQDGLAPIKDLLEADHDPLDLEPLVDTLHVVNVAANDPNRWFFVHRGRNTEESAGDGQWLSSIPYPAFREQAEEAYFRAKLRRRPSYDFVWRQTTTALGYRRLVTGVTDDMGCVQHVVIAAIHEAA